MGRHCTQQTPQNKTGNQHITMALTLLKGHAKELFQEALKFCQLDGPKGIHNSTDTMIFTLALNDTGRHFFPLKRAYQRQFDYMLHYLKLDGTQAVCEFTACLQELNFYLPAIFSCQSNNRSAISIHKRRTEQHPQPHKTSQMASGDANSKH